MKLRSKELLVAVAIISSATVLQIHEHMQPHEATSASEQSASPSCGATRDGLAPAACEPTRDESQTDHATRHQHSAPQIWV